VVFASCGKAGVRVAGAGIASTVRRRSSAVKLDEDRNIRPGALHATAAAKDAQRTKTSGDLLHFEDLQLSLCVGATSRVCHPSGKRSTVYIHFVTTLLDSKSGWKGSDIHPQNLNGVAVISRMKKTK
jgi:hypothetical protein